MRSLEPRLWTRLILLAVAMICVGCGSPVSTARGRGSAPARISFIPTPGAPFGVAIARDGRYAFVAVAPGRVLIYSLSGSRPRLSRAISVPGGAVGCSLTRDGRLLLVADGAQGASVISVARAERGAAHPVLGTLAPPRSAHLAAGGAIETASSVDGRFAFVSLEYGRGASGSGAVAVYDLGSDTEPRLGPGDYRGAISLGEAVVGSALSPDGSRLYVTSELRAGAEPTSGSDVDGTLSVISVSRAETDPGASAVLSTATAMNQPVRVVVSADGRIAWVTARGSDRLLAFSTARLLSDPGDAVIATARTGTAPVGLALLGGDSRILVADSDRFGVPGGHPALSVVDASAVLAHRVARTVTLPAGRFPREIAVAPDGRIALVSNFGSDQLESLDLTALR